MSTDDKAADKGDAKAVLSEDELDKVSGGHVAVDVHQSGVHQSGAHQSGVKQDGAHASVLKF